MLQFIGHLHPLFVHLPIGFFIAAALFHLLKKRPNMEGLSLAISIMVVAGFVSALFSVITGYVLSLNDGYGEGKLGAHQNSALLTTVVSLGWIYTQFTKQSGWKYELSVWATIAMIAITGHLGGSITHGEEYLAFGGSQYKAPARKAISDIPNASIFNQVVQPILLEKCAACHNKSKQKGGLRLDDSAAIKKGGKSGEIIKGAGTSSELWNRIHLPLKDEDHMPPEKEQQLTVAEMSLLSWWMQSGASFTGSFKEKQAPDSILQKVKTWNTVVEKSTEDWWPKEAVKPASEAVVQDLKKAGFAVSTLAQNSAYISISAIAKDSITTADIEKLLTIKDQLVSLNLNRHALSKEQIQKIAQLNTLRKLYLEGCGLNNELVKELRPLKQLVYLNLSNNDLNSAVVSNFEKWESLRSLYFFKTKLSSSDSVALKKIMPKATIVIGDYRLPMLEGDTSEVKLPPAK